MAHFSPSIEQQKHFIITIWEWRGVATMDKSFLCVYRHLVTNCLHGTAAEPCLAGNNRVTTTKYMSTLLSSSAYVTLSITLCW